ncbi:MAG: group 1 truncated hemoglobin [Gammaproteobacteria bacterium]|nr:group 1 truncated hemoglobin [Gammaproteobacteria bacterium]
MSESLFEKIGGEAAVDVAVYIFYQKVLDDDRVNRFFRGVDLEDQAKKQKDFLTFVFGGPNNYTGKNVREGHARLVAERGLNDEHFDAIIEHLGSTLVELGVPGKLVAECAAIAESTRTEVLNRNVGDTVT